MKRKLFPAVTFVLTLLSSLFWVALRVNYSGISKFLGADTNQSFLVMNLPVMVCLLAWLGFVLALVGLLQWDRRKWPAVTGFVIGIVVSLAAAAVVLFGAKDYLRFISVHFWRSVAAAAGILVFAAVLFFPVKNSRKSLWWKTGLVAVLIGVTVVLGYGLRPCSFTYGAVVYAVEDTYQIVFSTSDSAAAWVEIGGENYYDLYAGSMRSADRVHKVTVPQSVLDAAGGYTTCAQQMIYRGPFGGYKGEVLRREYGFRSVDGTDGLHYYALSDVHEAVDAAVRSTTYPYEAETDFVVLLGDLVSMVETEEDAQLANELAHGITKGEIPVIYARGNHEIKGEYAEVLYKYVGSKDQGFSYPVTLGDQVFAVVLDMGEDHEDDWWEYYGTAQFDLYREEQSRMLEQILEEGTYRQYPYRMALCHIPITYVEKDGLFEAFRLEWTDLLNEMEMDISLSGHLHEIWQILPGAVEPYTEPVYTFDFIGDSEKSPGGYLTDAQFPALLVGRRALQQTGGTQQNGYSEYMGTHISVDQALGRQIANYVNSQPAILTCVYPFEGNYPYRTFQDLEMELRNSEKSVANSDEIG